MDGAIVRFLNSGVGRFAPLDRLMEALVSDYLAPVFGSLVLVGLWLWGNDAARPRNQTLTIAGAGSVGIANAVTTLLNTAVDRARPFAEHDLTLLFYEPTDSSFPSNAAAVGFALATVVFLRHRALGGWLYLLAFLWAFARVYAGVHYPSDVITGAAIGAVSALAVAATFVPPFALLAFVPRLALRALRRVYAA